jgi:xylan 1,4-beta-xylosidase
LASFASTAATVAIAKPVQPIPAASSGQDWASMRWGFGIEGQRKADLGNGTFLNPVLSGDHPDPSILRHGSDYYVVFSTFDAYPGLLIWHSRDLVNWQPVGAALKTPVGSVYAPDLCYHNGVFYIYFPTSTVEGKKNWVITATDIGGPWSEPVDLHLPGYIDPNHVVDENGKRYLALSAGDLVALTDDGLVLAGAPVHIYDPWRYPDDWVVEAFAPEGPKIFRHNGYYYMLTAVGGTAGPPTGHMVIVARARSLQGPWENAPNNPIVHTRSAREKWWSRGHASAVVAPDGQWWLIYHGYENGYWTLGRQTLLSPMHWTSDGWISAGGGDLSKPLRKPGGGDIVTPGMPLSDSFAIDRFGTLWSFYRPGPEEARRVRYADGAMIVAGKGTGPADCSPICFKSGDLRYQVEVDVSLSGNAEAGLLLFYNQRLYCGLGFTTDHLIMHRYGLPRAFPKPVGVKDRLLLRITNECNIVTIHYSIDGMRWTKFDVQMEVSGYNHNTGYDFLSLRPALYAAGAGEANFRDCRYRAW